MELSIFALAFAIFVLIWTGRKNKSQSGHTLSSVFTLERKNEQIKKLDLKPTDQPNIYKRTIIGGYITKNGHGKIINDIVQISHIRYKWTGGNMLYLGMDQKDLSREVYDMLKKPALSEPIG